MDSFHQIQLGCVYRGLTPLSDEEVLNLYGQHYIPADYLESYVQNGSQQVCLGFTEFITVGHT